MKVYLAGPMRGLPAFNRAAFVAGGKVLRELGHEVFNPSDNDLETYGGKIFNPTGSIEQAERQVSLDLRQVFAVDTNWICQHAEAIALLPGWEKSKGATAEKAIAEALGLQVIYL